MKTRQTYLTVASTVHRVFEIHEMNAYNESKEKPIIINQVVEKKTKRGS